MLGKKGYRSEQIVYTEQVVDNTVHGNTYVQDNTYVQANSMYVQVYAYTCVSMCNICKWCDWSVMFTYHRL